MKRLVFLLLRLSMLPAVVRAFVQRRRVTIVLYHDPDPVTAREHFAVLKANYNIISLRQYLDAREAGSMASLPPKPMVITFDDGHAGNYRLRPVLEELRIPVTVFLCSGIVGTNRHFWFKEKLKGQGVQELKRIPDEDRLRALGESGFSETREYDDRQALSADEIHDMKPLVDFQAHTRFHVLLPQCGDQRARQEIEQCKAELEQNFGLGTYAFSYPNGDYSDREIELAREAGYECAITVDPGYNDAKTDPFRLKRVCIDDNADVNEMLVKASGVWALMKKLANRQRWGYVERPGGG